MHGLQACLFKYIIVAAFCIYAQHGEDAAKREALNSHGNYIVYHEKSWKNHGIVFLNFCGNQYGCDSIARLYFISRALE